MRRNIFIAIAVGLVIIAAIIALWPRGNEIKISANSTENFEKIMKNASQAIEQKDWLTARKLLTEAKLLTSDVDKIEEINKKLEAVNLEIIYSPNVFDECSVEYVVKPNDTLSKIAKEYHTTVELIKHINNLNSDIIHPNQKLKVYNCQFSILVDKSSNRLFLKSQGKIIKTYVVSTGKNNCTPTGTFEIVNKLSNPTWFKAGAVVPPDSPENILGTRWLGFDIPGYGIHGNRNADEIGKQVTQGCVRMYNEEVEQLYELIPIGTPVTIVD